IPIVPFKLNQERRHHIPRQRRQVTNWPAYDASLRQRGSLTVWFTDEAVDAWAAEPRTTRGGQPWYSPLALVIEAAEERLEPEHSGELGPDPFELHQERGRGLGHSRHTDLRFRSQQRVALRLDLGDLAQHDLDPLDFAQDARFEVRRQDAPIGGAQRVEPLASVSAQRIVVRDALGHEHPADPVGVLDPLRDERLPLPRE